MTIPGILHIAFPAFRTLLLLPLFFALHYPRVEFAPVENAEARETQPTASTFLVAPQPIRASAGLSPLSSKYGTFSDRSPAPSSNPSTRAPTPVPQHAGPSKKKQKDEVTYNPSWSEFQHRLKNITPYLWPSRSRSLQAIAVRLDLVRLIVVYAHLPLGPLYLIIGCRSCCECLPSSDPRKACRRTGGGQWDLLLAIPPHLHRSTIPPEQWRYCCPS